VFSYAVCDDVGHLGTRCVLLLERVLLLECVLDDVGHLGTRQLLALECVLLLERVLLR